MNAISNFGTLKTKNTNININKYINYKRQNSRNNNEKEKFGNSKNKSKSVGTFKLKNTRNHNDSATNILKIIKTSNNKNKNFTNNNINYNYSTKLKDLDLDDLVIQTKDNFKGLENKSDAHEDIIENINQKLIGLESKCKPFKEENFDLVENENFKLKRKLRKVSRENEIHENFVIINKREEPNYELNKNSPYGLLQNTKNLKNKNLIFNGKTPNSELVMIYPTARRLKTRDEVNNKNRNYASAVNCKSDSLPHKNFSNNLTNQKDNIVNINSLSLKRFIVIGGYPAIREALIQRNWIELTDNERYLN